MNKHLKKLIELGAIVVGRKREIDGFTIFERVSNEELENISDAEIAFATKAMGRAIFTLGENGKIVNHKGVDSHLSNEESASMNLVRADAAYSSKNGEDYVTSNFPVNLVIFPGSRPDVRIRGLSPLEDLEIEAYINSRMQDKGIKLPIIKEVREFSNSFCERFGLPIKVDGDYSEFNSDYQDENDKIKQTLRSVYENRYSEEDIPGKRPETLGEYFRRINLSQDPNIANFLKEKGIPFESFIEFVDNSYSLGQRYGQAIREIETPFRIADIEYYTKQKNVDVLESIAAFTEEMYPDRVPFENYFATQLGTNLANMMNHGWCCENFSHRQDYAITGEMCDDSYVYIPEKLKDAEKFRETDEGRVKATKSEIRLKFFLQTYLLSSNIKVLQDAMFLRGKDKTEIDSVLDDFINSFIENLDIEKTASNIPNATPDKVRQAFEILARTPKNITKLLAFQLTGPEKSDCNEEVLAAHGQNNAFYDHVSFKLCEKLGFQHTFINETMQDIKGVDPYEFLEERSI